MKYDLSPRKEQLTEEEQKEGRLLQIFMEEFPTLPPDIQRELVENMGLDKVAPTWFGKYTAKQSSPANPEISKNAPEEA